MESDLHTQVIEPVWFAYKQRERALLAKACIMRRSKSRTPFTVATTLSIRYVCRRQRLRKVGLFNRFLYAELDVSTIRATSTEPNKLHEWRWFDRLKAYKEKRNGCAFRSDACLEGWEHCLGPKGHSQTHRYDLSVKCAKASEKAEGLGKEKREAKTRIMPELARPHSTRANRMDRIARSFRHQSQPPPFGSPSSNATPRKSQLPF